MSDRRASIRGSGIARHQGRSHRVDRRERLSAAGSRTGDTRRQETRRREARRSGARRPEIRDVRNNRGSQRAEDLRSRLNRQRAAIHEARRDEVVREPHGESFTRAGRRSEQAAAARRERAIVFAPVARVSPVVTPCPRRHDGTEPECEEYAARQLRPETATSGGRAARRTWLNSPYGLYILAKQQMFLECGVSRENRSFARLRARFLSEMRGLSHSARAPYFSRAKELRRAGELPAGAPRPRWSPFVRQEHLRSGASRDASSPGSFVEDGAVAGPSGIARRATVDEDPAESAAQAMAEPGVATDDLSERVARMAIDGVAVVPSASVENWRSAIARAGSNVENWRRSA